MAVFQEAARFVRKTADPINSWIGGSAAGYILSASQRLSDHKTPDKTRLKAVI